MSADSVLGILVFTCKGQLDYFRAKFTHLDLRLGSRCRY